MNNPVVIYIILALSVFNSSRYVSIIIKNGMDFESIFFFVVNLFVICAIIIDRIKARETKET